MRGILLRAIESQTPIEIIYLSKDGSITQRKLRVLAIIDHQIKAFCFSSNKYRVFNLLNILSVSPVRKRYRDA
ncbi:hypothetical protein ACFSO7_07540 [Bacillus sp. CGMCC 1.16607]|uniref:hypothetical protein n=1 Tax=Bacillus sp. CGMCC 1.16607 TaxID=3351842 RepID=UPI003644D45E